MKYIAQMGSRCGGWALGILFFAVVQDTKSNIKADRKKVASEELRNASRTFPLIKLLIKLQMTYLKFISGFYAENLFSKSNKKREEALTTFTACLEHKIQLLYAKSED